LRFVEKGKCPIEENVDSVSMDLWDILIVLEFFWTE
jgi:hypothetical protein